MSSLLSLAPSGVFQRSLLPIEPVCSYHTFSPLPCYGGIFSVALSLGFPPPGITWHCVFAEPGLSSLKKIKVISRLSSNPNLILNYRSSSKFNFFFDKIITNMQAFFIYLTIHKVLSESSLKSYGNNLKIFFRINIFRNFF